MQEESSSYLQFARIPDEDDTRKILLQMGNQSVHVSISMSISQYLSVSPYEYLPMSISQFTVASGALLVQHIGQEIPGKNP